MPISKHQLLRAYFYIKHNQPVTAAQIIERLYPKPKSYCIESVLSALARSGHLVWEQEAVRSGGGRGRSTIIEYGILEAVK